MITKAKKLFRSSYLCIHIKLLHDGKIPDRCRKHGRMHSQVARSSSSLENDNVYPAGKASKPAGGRDLSPMPQNIQRIITKGPHRRYSQEKGPEDYD